ncbi:cystathionine gamma-synthase [Sulfobacillus thermosulfidooxidans]|nr:aminotransferase class I/II-fold pyridoxal phosphate-dependent enzyme [Sulfobacillus thermosulfidooxidans]OLZ08241.1 cystathionine gamma-synthase [Sulfobacillus thermosulfidooxidans]OLZ14009.1 cystathionine gamma-synthase [Sulfobacillus thermosulfidooxidans]OLZ19899.1 cystathionine gamma-synthase [Sulfobacillus thermosulfidooxidans]
MDMLTKLIHNPALMDKYTGASSIPVYHGSTYHQDLADTAVRWTYSRIGNPTRQALEDTIAELEEGVRGFAFASGMAAIAAVFTLLGQGDHIILPYDLYGGTYHLMTTMVERFGLSASFVDMTNLTAVENALTPRTRALYIETPSNPLMKITDIRGIVQIAQHHRLLTIADNTFMSPYLQRPLTLGCDIVIHSATKFLGGHSDVVAGLVVVKDPQLGDRIAQIQKDWGGILGPEDSWLVIRGIKTLGVRMDRAQQNAQYLTRWLKSQPQIKQVYYPGLPGHDGTALHHSQALGPGCVFSLRFQDPNYWKTFVNRLHYALYAVSLGGVETIVSHPATMSHASLTEEERRQQGITDDLLRVSMGIESLNDLLADFQQALEG